MSKSPPEPKRGSYPTKGPEPTRPHPPPRPTKPPTRFQSRQDRIEQIVAGWPEFTREQTNRLAVLLRPEPSVGKRAA